MKAYIAIPVYNAEPHPDECLNPALDPAHPDIEIIAVDGDGSTDSSPEILEGYADRIRVLGNPDGGTASSALNRGRRQMRGNRSRRLGAGDLPEPHAVEAPLVVHHTSLGSGPDRRTSCADCDSIDERGAPDPASALLGRECGCNGLFRFERSVILLDRFCGNGTAGMLRRAVPGRCWPSGGARGLYEGCEFWLGCRPPHGSTMRFVPGVAARWRAPAASQTTALRGAGPRCGGGGDCMRHTRTAVARAPHPPIVLAAARRGRA